VLHRECSSSCEIVVTNKILDGADVIRECFGEGEGLTHQAGHALSQRVIEALNVIGFPGVLRDGTVLPRWNDPFIDGILVRMKRRLCTVEQRNIGLEFLAALVATISHMKRNALAGGRIHGDPDPLFVRLLLYKAPHLISFGFQTGQEHRWGLCWELHMQVIRARRKAFDHKVQEPRETDAHGTADPTEGDTLAQQVFDLHALLMGNALVNSISRKLAAARFTLMILLPVTGMAVFLVPGRSPCWARISDNHGCW
jgi:hypothetical protein